MNNASQFDKMIAHAESSIGLEDAFYDDCYSYISQVTIDAGMALRGISSKSDFIKIWILYKLRRDNIYFTCCKNHLLTLAESKDRDLLNEVALYALKVDAIPRIVARLALMRMLRNSCIPFLIRLRILMVLKRASKSDSPTSSKNPPQP